MSNTLKGIVMGSLVLGSLLAAAPAFAQSTSPGQPGGPGGWGPRSHGPAIVGTVSAIAGSTLTVNGKELGPGQSNAASAFTVDANNAIVLKDGATSSLNAVGVGDRVMVQGSVSGSSVMATTIRDGVPAGTSFGRWGNANSAHPFSKGAYPAGNGEPVVGGSVTGINGSTLTVTNKSNVTYAINASNATVFKRGATSTVASIATGDNVIVQGTVNGTSVVASSIIDSGTAQNAAGTSTPSSGSTAPRGIGGIFGMIGGFFRHLFGFF